MLQYFVKSIANPYFRCHRLIMGYIFEADSVVDRATEGKVS